MPARTLTAAALALLLATAAHAGDCFNDDGPLRTDLEPPAPGSQPAVLRISDEDVASVLARIAAHEQRRTQQASNR